MARTSDQDTSPQVLSLKGLMEQCGSVWCNRPAEGGVSFKSSFPTGTKPPFHGRFHQVDEYASAKT
jgi:hypothetical protein